MSEASDPATGCVAVTPSDTTVLDCRALFVGGAGNVAIATRDRPTATAVTFTGVLAGSILPVAAYKVMATNTTATNIVALY
jgi:hypothetical protein